MRIVIRSSFINSTCKRNTIVSLLYPSDNFPQLSYMRVESFST